MAASFAIGDVALVLMDVFDLTGLYFADLSSIIPYALEPCLDDRVSAVRAFWLGLVELVEWSVCYDASTTCAAMRKAEDAVKYAHLACR